MDKQVKILVIGDTDAGTPEFLRHQRGHYQFTYCARDNYANDSHHRPGRFYDWIVIDGESLGGDETELVQSLRTMGFLSEQGKGRAGHRCGVEWSRDGILQLRCCMQASQKEARHQAAVRRQSLDKQQGGFVFEYHAPVKKTG